MSAGLRPSGAAISKSADAIAQPLPGLGFSCLRLFLHRPLGLRRHAREGRTERRRVGVDGAQLNEGLVLVAVLDGVPQLAVQLLQRLGVPLGLLDPLAQDRPILIRLWLWASVTVWLTSSATFTSAMS